MAMISKCLPVFKFFIICAFAFGCAEKQEELAEYSIAINPWPGYEMLHLAKTQGYFLEEGVNVTFKEVSSLADSQRAFISGKVDGFTSTMVEAVQAHLLMNGGAKIIMIPDYSNGGDMIIAKEGIGSVKDLKGKVVGCEMNSLGLMVLQRALQRDGLTIDDVTIQNMEQLSGVSSLHKGELDAMVTYPPHSVEILKQEGFNRIFTTKSIPGEIIDVVTFREGALQENAELQQKMLNAWQKAVDFTQQNPDKAYKIMSEREGISMEDFKATIEEDVQVLDSKSMQTKLNDFSYLEESVENVCKLITGLISYDKDCSSVKSLVYKPNKS